MAAGSSRLGRDGDMERYGQERWGLGGDGGEWLGSGEGEEGLPAGGGTMVSDDGWEGRRGLMAVAAACGC